MDPRRQRNLTLAVFCLAALLVLSSPLNAKLKLRLSGCLRGNLELATGSQADYQQGTNDFPTSAAHLTEGATFGLTLGDRLTVGLEGHYVFSGKATLRDPSDGDTLRVDTYPHVQGFLTLGYAVYSRRTSTVRIQGGAGMTRLSRTDMRDYTSALGYQVTISVDKKTGFSWFIGPEWEVRLLPHVAGIVALRYVSTTLDQSQGSLAFLLGMAWNL